MKLTEIAALADRFLLAAVFLVAGATKLVDRAGSARAMRDFGVAAALAGPLGVMLPVLEIATAAALIPAALAWYGAAGAAALLALFMAVTGLTMARGRKPDCHCFGRLHSVPVGWPTLARSGVLAACAAFLVARGPLGIGPGVWTWFLGLDEHGRRVALVLAGVACLVFFRLVDRARPRPESVVTEAPIAPPAARPRPPAPRRPMPPPPPREPEPERIYPRGVGLDIGTPAPPFALPGISGRTHSLDSLRVPGKTLMLLFTSPYCESCQALWPSVVRWMREQDGWLRIVMISRGTAEENIAKIKGLGVEEVLLQRAFEVAESYDCSSTPSAVLVDEDGKIASPLALGAMSITELIKEGRAGKERQENS